MGRFRASEVSVASDFHFQEEETIEISRSLYGKQGHICCLCCCDTRRASIIVNFVYVVYCFFCAAATYVVAEGLVAIDSWFAVAYDAVDGLDDDDLQSDFHFVVDNYTWVIYLFQGICVLFGILGIEGALRFRPMWVLACAMWYLLQGLTSLVILGWGGLGILLASLWAYPNIMLYQEQVEGIMTEKNYFNEVHSCCCVGVENRRVTIGEAIENRLGVFS